MSPKVTLWLKGLVSAAIGSAATAVTLVIVDPGTFNLGSGLKHLGSVMLTSAVLSIAMYLKQSPLPNESAASPKT